MFRASLWQRLVRVVWRLHQRPDWEEFAGPDWPDRIMDVPVTDRFSAKQGRSTGRWILESHGRRLVVYLKRHHRLSWLRGLLARLRPWRAWSPAFQEREHLEWARGQGVPVPAVVAAGERLGPGLCFQSFLAVEELTNMIPLNEAIPLAAAQLPPMAFLRWKRSLIDELARLTQLLHGRDRFHKDLYLCHFYVDRDDCWRLPAWRGRVVMIDLHRLGWHPWTRLWWQVKDLAQLLYSSEVPGVTARDRLRFWRAYWQGATRIGLRRLLRWVVLLRWRNYRQHNLRRRKRIAAALLRGPQPKPVPTVGETSR